jgi:hypothetical protein
MGECPADQKKPNAREAVDFKEVGVTAKVIPSIDVAEAPFNIKDRLFRLRRMTVEPAGLSLGTAMPTGRRSFTSSRARLMSMRATAPCRSRIRPVMSWPRLRSHTGGRISATRPWCSSRLIS